MQRACASPPAFLAAMLMVPAAARANDGSTVTVSVDNAKVIRLPERTATVIVGNPIIADVSLQRNGVVVLTGKSFGSTNLIALDAAGTMLAESAISVRRAARRSSRCSAVWSGNPIPARRPASRGAARRRAALLHRGERADRPAQLDGDRGRGGRRGTLPGR